MIEVITQTKVCTKCGRELPATEEYFYKHKAWKCGFRSDCIDCCKERYDNNRDWVSAVTISHHNEMKSLVVGQYGGCCTICGITNPAFLTIDHINGGGNKQRRINGISGYKMYRWLIRNDFPSGFQILCWNHNWLKHIESIIRLDSRSSVYSHRYHQRLKRLVIDHYGGQCVCCGEINLDLLTIDHVNGSGSGRENRLSKIHGTTFYRILRDDDFPPGFRVLCFNCNCGRQFNGGICPHRSVL